MDGYRELGSVAITCELVDLRRVDESAILVELLVYFDTHGGERSGGLLGDRFDEQYVLTYWPPPVLSSEDLGSGDEFSDKPGVQLLHGDRSQPSFTGGCKHD
eukprot:SAG31_NODE_27619_length_423_cov_0.688272_1_plen_101_part_10